MVAGQHAAIRSCTREGTRGWFRCGSFCTRGTTALPQDSRRRVHAGVRDTFLPPAEGGAASGSLSVRRSLHSACDRTSHIQTNRPPLLQEEGVRFLLREPLTANDSISCAEDAGVQKKNAGITPASLRTFQFSIPHSSFSIVPSTLSTTLRVLPASGTPKLKRTKRSRFSGSSGDPIAVSRAPKSVTTGPGT